MLLKPRLAAAMLGIWLAIVAPLAAQTPASAGAQPGAPSTVAGSEQPEPNIKEISIIINGPQQISADAVRAHLSIREGMPFSQDLLERSYNSLMETGLYDYIETSRETIDANNVRVVISLIPNERISAVAFEGNKAFTKARLEEEIKTVAGSILDNSQIKQDQVKIFQFYQKSGYSRVKVTNTVDKNESTGTAVVTFHIDEGPDVVIEKIEFVGNNHIATGKLRDQMGTSTYNFWISWLTKSGRFQEDDFEADLVKLRQYYKSNGYLDVEIDDAQVEFEYPKPDELNLVIHVNEGIQYHLGAVTISGNSIFQEDTLKKLLTIKPGDVFSPEAVDKNAQSLQDRYGQSGYLKTSVTPIRKPNLETGNMDLDFHVNESEKFYLESIDIQGNTKTKSTVIVRELALSPGDVFDTVRMKTSEDRLNNTRFFNDTNGVPQVHLDPEDTTIPGKSNLRVTVKEGRTGDVSFMAGFSTVESVVGQVTLSQSNFDLFNYRNYFQGAGQKASISFTIGSYENSVNLSFEEPWLWQRELAGGFNIFRTETDYLSTTYNQLTTGVDFYLRKRLFELVEGTLMYTIENIEIKDVTTSAPPEVVAQQGNQSVSKISFTLLRDTRNSYLSTTNGTRFELINEVAGGPLGGQTDFYRVEGRAGWWMPTFTYGDQVVSIVGRTGSILPFDGKPVPYAERYFLGGQDNMRGYSYRNVGPAYINPASPANGEPAGGNTFAYLSPEYSFEVVNPIRFAVFYDVGFLNSSAFDFTTRDFKQDVGVGLRIMVLGAPFRLDLGYPLNPNPFQSHSIQFNVSFGTVF